MSSKAVTISHFSDVLCVWAYIAQVRMDELCRHFGDEVRIEYRFLQVFGDVAGKLQTQWAARGGLEGYAEHVQSVAARFTHIEISPRAWIANTPTSSLPAQLLLCAVRSRYDQATVECLLRALRHAFFVELIDISDQGQLLDITGASGIDVDAVRRALGDGSAHAALAGDLAAATAAGVRASPALVFNEARQILTGNVGYRVIEANVRELLRESGDQQTWC